MPGVCCFGYLLFRDQFFKTEQVIYDTFYMGFCVKLFFNNKYTEILPSNGTVIALYYQFMKHKLCLLQSKSKVPGVGPVLVSP